VVCSKWFCIVATNGLSMLINHFFILNIHRKWWKSILYIFILKILLRFPSYQLNVSSSLRMFWLLVYSWISSSYLIFLFPMKIFFHCNNFQKETSEKMKGLFMQGRFWVEFFIRVDNNFKWLACFKPFHPSQYAIYYNFWDDAFQEIQVKILLVNSWSINSGFLLFATLINVIYQQIFGNKVTISYSDIK
jgi:hypothetical protein